MTSIKVLDFDKSFGIELKGSFFSYAFSLSQHNYHKVLVLLFSHSLIFFKCFADIDILIIEEKANKILNPIGVKEENEIANRIANVHDNRLFLFFGIDAIECQCHTCFSKKNQVQTYIHARIKFHAYSDI
jgi:hypothetical protein